MKKITLFIVFNIIFGISIFSQETLLTIDNTPITNSEFKRIFLKNNNTTPPTEKDIDEYLELFINFKLKVQEAINLGYDTTKNFKDEYNKYITQLAEPFFIDTNLQTKLLKEAYLRSKKEVRLSYIVIIPEKGDTAEAHKRVTRIYKRLQNGEDFQKVAMETSDSKNKLKNKGDAWYNKVFMMPYQIENFAFDNNIGDISQPIFTNKAFFIIKITDTRTTPKKVRASHIYIRLPKSPTLEDSLKAMQLIDSINIAFKSGLSFEEIAKEYSQDKGSANKGGDLGWFSTGKMFKDFETATYSIKNIGDYIGPIRTPAGYHFIKLTDKQELGTFKQEQNELISSLKKSKRYNSVKENIILNLKKEYNYTQINNLKDFSDGLDTLIYIAKWSPDKYIGDKRILATFSNQELTFEDFANYLSKNQLYIYKETLDKNIAQKYSEYVNYKIKEYEISQLPKKDKQYKYISQEYHDGLLLFDITNNMVWEKAINDTLGLQKFYSQNRNNYLEKFNLTIYTFSDEKTLKKAIKLLKNKDKKSLSDTMIVVLANKKSQNLSLEQSGLFKPGDNASVDYVIELMKKDKIANSQKIVIDKENMKIIYIKDRLFAIKGLVTADYQNILEEKWIEELRKKYNVKINQEILSKTKKELIKKIK